MIPDLELGFVTTIQNKSMDLDSTLDDTILFETFSQDKEGFILKFDNVMVPGIFF